LLTGLPFGAALARSFCWVRDALSLLGAVPAGGASDPTERAPSPALRSA
jgi:hypothetical protein